MKKSNRLIKSLILFSLLAVQTLQAQDSTAIRKIKSFSQHFIAFSKAYPQEKVYLHFDNTAYYLGESIWFKAYAVRADRNSLGSISKVLYVEMLNSEGYVLETKKLKLENGECHGDFKLSTTNYGGFYEIRAYTRYMLNFGQDNYFSRVFPVYDSPQTPSEYKPSISERPRSQAIPEIRANYNQKGSLVLNFYPEGGSLVAGLTSKVAFKATGKNGEDVAVSGIVVNDKNEKIADINSGYLNMGAFQFTPGAGKYVAKVAAQNRDYKFELPTVLIKGYTMTVSYLSDENINIYVQRNRNTKNEPLGLSISCRGALYAFNELNMDTDSVIAFKYYKKALPSGVAQITLYNTSGEILSERMVFVNHQDQLKINVSQNKPSYEPFEKVNLAFQLNDAQNNPIETTFSLAVRDAATSPDNSYSNNILSDLLLSSEISGYIENPGYYFQSNDNSRRQALELLLLTQGWCKYSWKQMAGVKPFVLKHNVEKQLTLDGHVASILLKKKLKNIDLSLLLMTDSSSQHGKYKTDLDGNFNFALLDFNGEGKLILQTSAKNKRKDSRIMLNRQFSPEPRPYVLPQLNAKQYFNIAMDTALTVNSSINDSSDLHSPKSDSKFTMDKKDHLLKEVTVKEKRSPVKVSLKYDVTTEMDKMEDTGEWEPTDIYGFLQKTNSYFIKTIQPNGSMKITYKGRNVRFISRDAGSTFATELGDDFSYESGSRGNPNSGFIGRLPLLDEIKSISIIEDYGAIMNIMRNIADPGKIVLAVVTLKESYISIPNGVRNTTYSGYSYVKEFYSPQYNKFQRPKDRDYRRTLYWNPNIKTSKDGKAYISFFNNNSCKTMNINAETVTGNGVVGVLNK